MSGTMLAWTDIADWPVEVMTDGATRCGRVITAKDPAHRQHMQSRAQDCNVGERCGALLGDWRNVSGLMDLVEAHARTDHGWELS